MSLRSGLPLPALSRLESGKSVRPTFETLAGSVSGVGLEVDVVVRERAKSERQASTAEDEVLTVRSWDLDRLLATIHGQIDALRALTEPAPGQVAK